ncbi:inter-alpha-trypsin inhibitor heavy chain H3-like isoform X2 [Homarus americanus]|uniref:inter-alpha-trypsin inhibitor heavy chain H3-like isoform X2 n=1 Tax=Homarus americanus TaxID=6706 RepID=UPI001C47D232|nr:inter-alpha-trypsin inhibitor heavy chain H3-like isoform X2 [Homarus americanus]
MRRMGRMMCPAQVWLLLHLLLLHFSQVRGMAGVVTSLKINTKIEHRYAITQVTSAMRNPLPQSAELQYQLMLPKNALISSFIMEVSGANYTGIIREKSVSRRIYEMAKKVGKTTGLLEHKDDAIQKFEASINMVSHGTVTFHITYEELVHRVDGSYLYSVHIHPGHRIPSAEIDVHIMEREAIIDYKFLELPGQEMFSHNPGTSVQGGPMSLGELHLWYRHEDPHDNSGRGIDGVFTLSYTTTNHTDGGEVQRVGNYFAHYFSPEGLLKMPTHTVFLIDVSYSMNDGKLDSLKSALIPILRGMNSEDTFELLAFSSDVVNVGSFNGRHKQIKNAIRKVRRLVSMGYSNLNAAILQAIRTTNNFNAHQAVKQIVIFTDGQSNNGVVNPEIIRKNVREANTYRCPIFSFVFGSADLKLLTHISEDNVGIAYYLNYNSDQAAQIKDFYKQISKPLISGVDINYPETNVDPTTIVKPGLSNYYSGGELVFAGLLRPGATGVNPIVSGVGRDGPYQFPVTRLDSRQPFHTSLRENFTARLWAYLIVQDLLARADLSENVTETQQFHAQALQIALRFGFVTRLTSLVVVYPDDEYVIVSSQDELHHERNWHHPNNYESSFSSFRRLGRSNIRADLDPHFIVYAQGFNLPLCFNFHGHNGAYMNLIRDPQSGITVNGQVTSRISHPKMTYFTTLFLRLNQVNITITPDRLEVDCLGDDGTPQVTSITKSLWPFYKKNGRRYKHGTDKKLRSSHRKPKQRTRHTGQRRPHEEKKISLDIHRHYTYNRITHYNSYNRPNHYFSYERTNNQNSNFQDDDINSRIRRFNDEASKYCSLNSTWKEGVGRIYGNVLIVLDKKKNLHVTIGDGLAHFAVVRSRNKLGQRFLGFYIKDQQILSPLTHGIIGQFTTKTVKLISPTRIAASRNNSTESTVKVAVNRRNRRNKYRPSEVSGILSKRHSLLDQTNVDCIHIRGNGKGLLDGQPRDYLLNCLHC